MNRIFSTNEISLLPGFWQEKETLNRVATLPAVYDRFTETGRVAAFRCDWKEGAPGKPHYFWDSDVAKWMEGAAYSLRHFPDPALEADIESLIDDIEANQHPDGYFNIYYTVVEPGRRFTDRRNHELYCAGHLIEAAVAWAEATGRDRFLKLMERYVDCIYDTFVVRDAASFRTPGHEEIELALIRLYRHTRNPRPLELARFFLDQRGTNAKDSENYEWSEPNYTQSHLPVREQHEAFGHAVRACYLYSAMADFAAETGDASMTSACRDLLRDIAFRKMYVTGGIGSTRQGEAFTVPYDLPNATAYAETCASISLAMFATRMLQIEADSLYADIAERALLNGVLAGLSLDGTSFFYENPLEIRVAGAARHTSTRYSDSLAIRQRVKVFSCSCCPPNLNRVLASVGTHAFGLAEDGSVYVHQYIASRLESGAAKLSVETDYPRSGMIRVRAEGVPSVRLRIPAWSRGNFRLNRPYTMENGYAEVRDLSGEIVLRLDMTPRLVLADPRVSEDSGKVAVARGPVVYCAEGVDQDGAPLSALSVALPFRAEESAADGIPLPCLDVGGFLLAGPQDGPYADYPGGGYVPRKIRLIPYACYANRGETDMSVFLPVCPGRDSVG